MINNSFFNLSGKSFLEIGNFEIRWYAIFIIMGIIAAWILSKREGKKLGISVNKILDGIIICVPLAIIGARAYYIIFDEDKATNFPTIASWFNVRNGGLAIMGGVIVAIIFVIIYCRKRKMPVLSVFDLLAPGLLIGQAFGRWGNWFNGEAHGGIMSQGVANFYNKIMPWIMKKMSMEYCGEGTRSATTYYHPTFLYESLWNVLGLIIILITRRKFKKVQVGDYIAFYMVWYGLGRSILIEPFRTDQLQKVLGVPVNILIPAIMAVVGITWLILKRVTKKFRMRYYYEVVEEVKNDKPDTYSFKLEGVVINFNNIIREAYYYTFNDCLNILKDAKELDSYVKKNYLDVLKEEKLINYFNEYIINHLQESTTSKSCAKLFKKLFKQGYNILVYSKYSKEVIEASLVKAKINTYVSVYQEDLTDILTIVDTFNNVKKNLVFSNNLTELGNIKNIKVVKCYCNNNKRKDGIGGVDYIITSFDEAIDFLYL